MRLECADDPLAWAALGFTVGDVLRLGAAEIRFSGDGEGGGEGGLRGWALRGDALPTTIDGIPTTQKVCLQETSTSRFLHAVEHPNGAFELDHVVVMTDSRDRTAAALVEAGGEERRRAGPPQVPVAMAFVRVDGVVVEVAEGGGPPRLWGIVAVVPDLDALDRTLVGEPKDAVQPGRRIATVRREAGLGTHVAFMTPRVRAH
jgi:hypothetical protein